MLNTKFITKGIGILLLSMFSLANADIDHFEITASPTTSKVGEALDLTITAMDKDNNTVSDYEGSILVFSESDPDAEYPGVLAENTYTFKLSDEGSVKFENSVKFSSEGTHDISVYDFNNEEVYGITQVEISNTEAAPETKEIVITSPDNGLTVGENSLLVSGTTDRNHKIIVKVNAEQEFETQSDSDGTFEVEINELPDNSESVIIAYIYDADDNVIGESSQVKIKVENSSPRLSSILLSEEEVDAETVVGVEVIANKGLKSVEIIFNDTITALDEVEEGKYTGNITAPKESGEFPLDVLLKDDLGHETEESSVKTLKVNAVEIIEEEIIEEEPTVELEAAAEEEVVEEEPTVELEAAELSLAEKLAITGLKLTKLKTKSVLSWDENEFAESYKVYKKDSVTGEMNLIENVTEPRVTIHITGDVVKYDDFAVKGVAKDLEGIETEASEYSEMTKVQTGPAEMILLLIISMLAGAFVLNRKKA